MQACTCASTSALHAGHMLCQPAAHEQRPAPTSCFGHMSVSEAATSAGAAPATGGAQMARSLHLSSRYRRLSDVVGYGRFCTRRASFRAARVRPRRRRRSVSRTGIHTLVQRLAARRVLFPVVSKWRLARSSRKARLGWRRGEGVAALAVQFSSPLPHHDAALLVNTDAS